MSRPVDVLIAHMRGVTCSKNEWQAGFAKSILKQARRPGWYPSRKQIATMDKIVAELFRESENDFAVIEE